MPSEGEWVRFRVMRAWEWAAPAVNWVTITVGKSEGDATWWQMVGEKDKGRTFVVQALSERVPMCTENGDVGTVYRYVFSAGDGPALEYVDRYTGLAYLPKFGFRDGLVPTPRSRMNVIGGFFGTGNYLGQPLSCQGHGPAGEWMDLGPLRKLVLDGEFVIGNFRPFRDDGKGVDAQGRYTCIDMVEADYDTMIDAGCNIFLVDAKHAKLVRDKAVFFVKRTFGGDGYPEMLYRSNYWGTTDHIDEPATRLDSMECRTVYDALNMLRLRNVCYTREPSLSYRDAVASMIQAAGYRLGDWYPKQTDVPVWETYAEACFDQVLAGASGAYQEGRYQLEGWNKLFRELLGPRATMTVEEMLRANYAWLRGPARCFGGTWGMSIYGQADYSIAPQAAKLAYDMGSSCLRYWQGDKPLADDHHLEWSRQLELSRLIRAYQKERPRRDMAKLVRAAKAAVAFPEGYINFGHNMWWAGRFDARHINEHGVPYGDVVAEAWWQVYRLAKAGVDYDIVTNVPEIDSAGYEKIVRIFPDGTTSLPDPPMPALPLPVTVTRAGTAQRGEPKPDAPKATARPAKPGSVRIDADLAEWSGVRWIALDRKLNYEDASPWAGPGDLSAKAAVAYDDDSIYLAVEVTDDIHDARYDGDDMWKSDCVQVGFDPLFSHSRDGFYEFDDSEIGLVMIDGRPFAHVWENQISGAVGPTEAIDLAVARTGSVTRYEARIPLATVRPLSPGFPGVCGFNIVVNDSDSGTRKGVAAWTSGITDGKNTGKWGVLEFANRQKSAAPISAWVTGADTMVPKGEPAGFVIEIGSRSAVDAELVLAVRHGKSRTEPTVTSVRLPAGRNRFEARVDTGALVSDSYHAEFVLRSGGKTACRQGVRFYVTP